MDDVIPELDFPPCTPLVVNIVSASCSRDDPISFTPAPAQTLLLSVLPNRGEADCSDFSTQQLTRRTEGPLLHSPRHLPVDSRLYGGISVKQYCPAKDGGHYLNRL